MVVHTGVHRSVLGILGCPISESRGLYHIVPPPPRLPWDSHVGERMSMAALDIPLWKH